MKSQAIALTAAVIMSAGAIMVAWDAQSLLVFLLAVLSSMIGVWTLFRESTIQGASVTARLLHQPALLAQQRAMIAEELGVLEDAQELQRGVFEVSAELVGCVLEDDARNRFAHAMRRYWSYNSADLMVWERGNWRSLGGEATGPAPSLDSPIALPQENDGDLVLDLSPGVAGQAALILRQALSQPSLKNRGLADQNYVAEVLRGQLALSLRRVMLYGELQSLARIDPLTGAHRRWYGEQRLGELVNDGEVVGVAMIDIDHFKRINDVHGHVAGDRVLAAVGAAISAHLRTGDLVCRYGGEEFLVILPDINPPDAELVAERVRAAIAEISNLPRRVTVSIGVAACHQDDTVADLVGRADKAMYEAKASGRNRVTPIELVSQSGTVRLLSRRKRKEESDRQKVGKAVPGRQEER